MTLRVLIVDDSAEKEPTMSSLPEDWTYDFGVAVEGDGGRTVVWVRGEVDIGTAPALRRALSDARIRQCRAGETEPLVVDLSDVTFMGATGLGVLANALVHARSFGSDLVLRNPSPMTLRVLDLTELLGVFEIELDARGLSPVLVPGPAGSPLAWV
jgi:anti-anti-sigma factor